jgi:hypothetical protein
MARKFVAVELEAEDHVAGRVWWRSFVSMVRPVVEARHVKEGCGGEAAKLRMELGEEHGGQVW